MEKKNQLGFPIPLLGMQSVRLPVLYDDGELLALAKPVNVLVQSDPWYPQIPVLIEAIRHQALAGKPEFVRRGIGSEGLWAVTDIDPECYGPVVFTRQRQVAEELKSKFGSGEFTFQYRFLSRSLVNESELECDLPLARHRLDKRMLVSHTTGKKSFTRMNRVEKIGPAEVWTGQTAYPRRHQLLIHALENRLSILGDERYAMEKPLLLSRLKRNYQPKRELDERPLYDGPAYYLEKVILPGNTVVTCPEPPKWKGLLKQLERSPRL